MAKKTIALFELGDWRKKYLQEHLKGFNLKFFSNDIDNRNLKKAADADILAVFVASQVTEEVLSRLPKVKFITTLSTGFDHIDLAAAAKRRIKVANVPFYGENTVAEHAMALLLAISRKIPESEARTDRGIFNYEGLMGFDLKGKTIGVIGTGHIGQHLIKMAHGFDMKVIAFDKFPDRKAAKQLGFTYVSLAQLLKQSDVISLHLPYMKATHHVLNSQNMKLIKKGAVLINTARGGLIETKAMVREFQKGRLAALGLDVLEEEENVQDHLALLSPKFSRTQLKTTIENYVLMTSPNVVMTPHNAFNSKEALIRILDTTVENIKDFVAGKKLKNEVKIR